jgi:hypothetical protein
MIFTEEVMRRVWGVQPLLTEKIPVIIFKQAWIHTMFYYHFYQTYVNRDRF